MLLMVIISIKQQASNFYFFVNDNAYWLNVALDKNNFYIEWHQ